MEIAYVGPVPPLPGGIAQHGARLTEALADIGYPVRIFSWSAQYPRLLYRGPSLDRTATRSPGARFSLRWWDPLSWWHVGREVRAADLMVFPWVTPFVAPAYRTMLAAAGSIPAVAVFHNVYPHEPGRADLLLTRWVIPRLRGALLHSRPEAEALRALAPNLRIDVAAHPPNLDMASAPLPQAPPYRLLFFGHVRPYKGLETAFDALSLLLKRGLPVELTVAGHFWTDEDEWKRRIEVAGIEAAVSLRPGYVPDEEVPPLFATHHVIVAPYRSASQSGIVPLARAAHRAVVATDVGGLSDSINDGLDGFLVPPDDPAAFADGIERVLRGDLGQPASGVAPNGTWADVAARVVELGT